MHNLDGQIKFVAELRSPCYKELPLNRQLGGRVMDAIRILRWEGLGFLVALTVLLAYRMLTRRINLRGLLGDGTDDGAVSPERVQLLVTTIAVSCNILRAALHGTTNALPEINTATLAIFGASSSVYAGVKAFKMLGPGSRIDSNDL